MSSVAWAEFLCGPVGEPEIRFESEICRSIVEFTAVDSETSARRFHLGGRRRGSLADCMIAAVALRARAVVATTNPKDFRRFAPAALEIVES